MPVGIAGDFFACRAAEPLGPAWTGGFSKGLDWKVLLWY
jgi:hypothetical protein